jgi:uncharacterized protein YqeY
MLEDKIYKDYVEALKNRNRDKSDFLSFVRSELKNSAINLRKDKLEDNETLDILKRIKKRLEEAKESVGSSGRTDFLEKTEKEIGILNEYLPKPLEENEILAIIERVISDVGASSLKDMGKVMKEVMAQVGAKADSKAVSDLVKRKLSSA